MLMKVLILLMVCVFISACESKLTEEQYLSQAKQYIETKNINGAIIQLKNTLKENANNLEAHSLLANLFLQRGEMGVANVEFQKIQQLGGERNTWVAGMAETLLYGGQLKKLHVLNSDGLSDDEAVKLLAFQSMGYTALGEFEKAQSSITSAEKYSLNEGVTNIAKIRLFLRLGQAAKAKELIDVVIKKDPDNPAVQLLLGGYEESIKQYEQAVLAYKKADETRPLIGEPLAKSVKLNIYLDKVDAAKKDLATLLERKQLSPLVYYVQGLISLKEGHSEEAAAFFERAAESPVPNLEATYLTAMIHMNQGRYGAANKFNTKLLKYSPNALNGLLLKANIRLKEGRYEESKFEARKILSADSSNLAALNILAYALYSQGAVAEGLNIYKKIIEISPNSSNSHLRYAAGLSSTGDVDLALAHVSKALAVDSSSNHAISMRVGLLIYKKEYQQALNFISSEEGKSADKAFHKILQSRVYFAQGLDNKAMDAVKAGCELDRSNIEPCLIYARLAIKEKKYEIASGVYSELLSANPKNLAVMVETAELYKLTSNTEGMLKLLDKAMSEYPQSLSPRLELAKYYFSQGRSNKSISVLSDIRGLYGDNVDFLAILISAQLQQGRKAEALGNSKQMLAIAPKNEKALFLHALSQFEQNDFKEAKKPLSELVKLNPEHLQGKILLARVLFRLGETKQSEGVLRQLDKKALERQPVLELMSGIAASKGEKEKAKKLAEKLLNKYPSSSTVLFFSQQTWLAGDKKTAFQLLEEWLVSHPRDNWVRSELASLYLLQGSQDKAIAMFEEVLKIDPKNLASLNNLAWQLKERAPERAYTLANNLNDLKSDVPVFLDTLAMVELELGKVEQALQHINRAVGLSESPSLILHKAIIQEKNGDWLAAIKSVTVLLKKNNEFAERKQAEELLVKLKDGR